MPHKIGDRTDFTFFDHVSRKNQTLVGTVTAVHKVPVCGPLPARTNYSIRSSGKAYYVLEENVSTPYGPDDDA